MSILTEYIDRDRQLCGFKADPAKTLDAIAMVCERAGKATLPMGSGMVMPVSDIAVLARKELAAMKGG